MGMTDPMYFGESQVHPVETLLPEEKGGQETGVQFRICFPVLLSKVLVSLYPGKQRGDDAFEVN